VRERDLAELERTFLVMTRADTAFDLLADPVRLPEYVPTLRLDDSIAIDGESDPDADLAERGGAPEAGFVADRKTLTITWARPERDYAGSITVSRRTTGTADITVRLHTRDDADAEFVTRTFDEAVANIRRLMTAATR